MKTKKELQEEAGKYFKQYPKVDVFFATGDGNFFTVESLAKSHANSDKELKKHHLNSDNKLELPTFKRGELIENTDGPLELPEGNPTKEGWTIPEIQQWLDNNEVKYSKAAKEDNLLSKVEEFLKSKEVPE